MDLLTGLLMPLLFTAGKTLFGGLAGLSQSRQLADRQRLQQRELEITARAERARAEQRAADRLRHVNRTIAANLARAGALGIAQSDSLHTLSQRSLETAARETDTDFVNAGLQASIARARAASVDPDATEALGWSLFVRGAGDAGGLFKTLGAPSWMGFSGTDDGEEGVFAPTRRLVRS